MADLSDRVAIIALVVSLIALIIASGQLLAQFFGTAEGYRRCNEAVIGPWHRLRWRKWLFTEFRYETNFTTPKILLCAEGHGPPSSELLRSFKPKAARKLTFWEVIWPKRKITKAEVHDVISATLSEYRRADEVVTKAAVYETAMERPKGGKVFSDFDDNVEKGWHSADVQHERAQMAGPELNDVTDDSGVELPNENKASWLQLISELHEVSRNCRSSIDPPTTTNLTVGPVAAAPGSNEGGGRAQTVHYGPATEIVIGVSRWTWDLMPSDMAKPLATTMLGALIVLAVRLGMEWRSLDKRNGQIHADRNGYSLSFIETPGLGWVARLSVSGRDATYSHPPYVQGMVADKMICGILPGCAHFVDRDVNFVSSYRAVREFEFIMLELANHYKYAENAIDDARENGLPGEADNDVIYLLAEYPLVTGQRAYAISFHGFTAKRTLFGFWEARLAMLRHLRKADAQDRLPSAQKQVLTYLEYLATEYPNDFYITGAFATRARVGKNPDEQAQKQANFHSDCRTIFDWTTSWLKGKAYDQRDHKDISRYVHLVIAHWCMSCSVASHAQETLARRRQEVTQTGKQWKKHHKHITYELDDVPVDYKFFFARIYESADAYVDDVTHPRRSNLHKYMRGLSFEDGGGEGNLVTAWWVLMLRGLVWQMPVVERTFGEPIPSSLYADTTPVWIT